LPSTSILQRDDAEAAKVYEDFVKEFGGDDGEGDTPSRQRNGHGAPPEPRPFIRGGTIRPGQPPAAAPPPPSQAVASEPASATPAARKPGGRYVPSFMPPGMAAALGDKDEAEEPKKEAEPVFQLPGSGAGKGKPRAIDALLANLKREQEEREARREAGLQLPREEAGPGMAGSHDAGDPFTTNLFIGNLAPDVDEQVRLAGVWG
jgi:U2-associated protein SR140